MNRALQAVARSPFFALSSQTDLASGLLFNYTICHKRDERRPANQFGGIRMNGYSDRLQRPR